MMNRLNAASRMNCLATRIRTRAVHVASCATILLSLLSFLVPARALLADETCMSPYMPKITGLEEYVYVWTLGIEGVGDGQDKLVTIDVKVSSDSYGEVIHSKSVGGRHEAHHGGFTDDRRQLWVAGLDTGYIFIFDVATNPGEPKLVKTIKDFTETTGLLGPHGMYALPGRMLIPCLSNAKDKGGRTAMVEYSNEGKHIATHWMPTMEDPRGAEIEFKADGYGYDARVLPRKNVILTSSFTGWSNYMRDFGDLTKDASAMENFGQTMVLWNFHTRQPKKVFRVPGAPLEIRWAWGPKRNYAFTATALTSKLWLIYEEMPDKWTAKEVATIGEKGKGVLPVDISLSSDDRTLFVSCFADGKCRVFTVYDALNPRLIYEADIGKQVNMVSQSWDGRRLYFSSSLLANWDKKGEQDEQFVKAYLWEGKRLWPKWSIDFKKLKLGRPHIMRFGSSSLYK